MNNKKKYILIGVIGIVVIFFALKMTGFINPIDGVNIFRYPVSKENVYFVKQLKKAIRQGKTEIPLSDLTNFDWDEVVFVGSYSAFQDQKRNLCGARDFDGSWGLAFIKKGQIIHCIDKKNDFISFDRNMNTNTKYDQFAQMRIENKIFVIERR